MCTWEFSMDPTYSYAQYLAPRSFLSSRSVADARVRSTPPPPRRRWRRGRGSWEATSLIKDERGIRNEVKDNMRLRCMLWMSQLTHSPWRFFPAIFGYRRSLVHSTYVHMCGTSMTKSSGLFGSFWDLDFLTFTKSTITRPKMTFIQHAKVPTYSTNRGLSKNAIKKVVILIGSKDIVFAKSLWRTGQVYSRWVDTYVRNCKGLFIRSPPKQRKKFGTRSFELVVTRRQ